MGRGSGEATTPSSDARGHVFNADGRQIRINGMRVIGFVVEAGEGKIDIFAREGEELSADQIRAALD